MNTGKNSINLVIRLYRLKLRWWLDKICSSINATLGYRLSARGATQWISIFRTIEKLTSPFLKHLDGKRQLENIKNIYTQRRC